MEDFTAPNYLKNDSSSNGTKNQSKECHNYLKNMSYIHIGSRGIYSKVKVLDQYQITTNATYEPPSQVGTTACNEISPHPQTNSRRIFFIVLRQADKLSPGSQYKYEFAGFCLDSGASESSISTKEEQ